jgi:ABC-type antimicrobial peptide transport system permease subunit
LLLLVLAEALMVGVLSGLLSTGIAYSFVNLILGGIKFPIAFFPKFLILTSVLVLGPLLGGITAFCGSILPAWTASRVKATDVFAKVT